MMVIGEAMFESGVAQTVGNAVIKVAQNSERRFILIGGVVAAVLSMFLANTAVIAMFLAVMSSVCKANKDIKLKNICLPISMGAMFGGICTLVGSTPQLTAQSILEGYCNETFKMWDFLPVGLCLLGIYLIFVLFIGYPLGNKVWGKELDNDEQSEDISDLDCTGNEGPTEQKVHKRKQIYMYCILVLMIILFSTEWLSNVITTIICASLCVLTGLVNEKQIYARVNWGVLFRLAGCLGIATGIDKSGCGELIANWFTTVFGPNVHPVVLLAVSVLMVMIISNFITNSTAVFVVLPPLLAICTQYGFNPIAFTIAICYGANLCFATPLANAQTGMTMVAGYKFQDYFRYNLILEVMVFIGIVVFVPIFWSLTI
jgi:di/tricarboxylate transporter